MAKNNLIKNLFIIILAIGIASTCKFQGSTSLPDSTSLQAAPSGSYYCYAAPLQECLGGTDKATDCLTPDNCGTVLQPGSNAINYNVLCSQSGLQSCMDTTKNAVGTGGAVAGGATVFAGVGGAAIGSGIGSAIGGALDAATNAAFNLHGNCVASVCTTAQNTAHTSSLSQPSTPNQPIQCDVDKLSGCASTNPKTNHADCILTSCNKNAQGGGNVQSCNFRLLQHCLTGGGGQSCARLSCVSDGSGPTESTQNQDLLLLGNDEEEEED